MKQEILQIQQNEKIAKDVYKMVLSGQLSAVTKPGQFINIKLDGFFCDGRFLCVIVQMC